MSPESHRALVHVVDGAAASVAVASLANVIPQMAATFTLVWTGMRIYEMVTGKPFSQSWLARWLTGHGQR
jgi:hypothetical protein